MPPKSNNSPSISKNNPMLVYTFDNTMDGVLSAVFDAYFRHQQPDMLVGEGEQLPLFCEEV